MHENWFTCVLGTDAKRFFFTSVGPFGFAHAGHERALTGRPIIMEQTLPALCSQFLL